MKPTDIPAVNRILKRDFHRQRAPVVELADAHAGDPFKILVATILSARTRDQMTLDVARRLFRVVRNAGDLRGFTQKQMEDLILPIGFFRTKARHLRQLPDVLDRDFAGRIPDTVEDLCRLPGVGRKTANLVRSVAFDKPAICVDVHVHRISNRLGLVHTRNPLATEKALRSALPLRYWKTWNRYLVSFGQTTCTPRNPRCSICPLFAFCLRRGVSSSR